MVNLIRKIKGKAQQVKGNLQMESDNPADKIKGGVSKIKGETNEAIADIDNNIDRDRRTFDDDRI